MASRVLAAALFGLAEALDPRQREQKPLVEEAPQPSDDDWLVLLDREEPRRSLVIIPHRVVSAGAGRGGGPAAWLSCSTSRAPAAARRRTSASTGPARAVPGRSAGHGRG